MTVHIIDFPIKWIYHLMLFYALYEYNNCFYLNSNLSTFWALENDKFSIKVRVLGCFMTK